MRAKLGSALVSVLMLLSVSAVLFGGSGLSKGGGLVAAAPPSGDKVENWVDYVDMFIGSHNCRWMLFPGPTRPFGMVKLSPDTRMLGHWDMGYDWNDDRVMGFSVNHSWTMVGVMVSPLTGGLMTSNEGHSSHFSHDGENASPGHYSVYLDDYGVLAELTATTHAGFLGFTFPESENSHVLFDLQIPSGDPSYILREGMIRKVGNNRIEGYMHVQDVAYSQEYIQRFVVEFSEPFEDFGGWLAEDQYWGIDNLVGSGDMGGFVKFSTSEGERILVKVGVSYVSIGQAWLNLETEIPEWNFDGVAEDARNEWNDLLGRVEVQGGTLEDKTKFYTGLYRTYSGRTTFTDVNWMYTGVFEDNRQTDNFPMLCSDAFWNTFWNCNQVWALLTPHFMNSWVRTQLEFYDMGGWISMGGGGVEYTNIMIADHAIPLIVGAYMMGIRDYDVEKAYEAVRKSSMVDPTGSIHEGHVGMTEYKELGYLPQEWAVGASRTLEYAFDDWCTAQMAKAMGDVDTYAHLMEVAHFYQNVYNENAQDPSGFRGFMALRYRDGSWAGLNPRLSAGWCEGNGWQHTWFVPHDPVGLATLMGGRENASEKLNWGFEHTPPGFSTYGAPIYHGNQPDMQVSFLFNYWGAPWLTQKWSRAIMEDAYGVTPYDGYSGDEDQGQLGAWYVMAAMGLFQMTGGVTPVYEIGSPLFDKITIHLDNSYYSGNDFVIIANHNSHENMYIQSATLNGEPLEKPWFWHSDLADGGTLEFWMGPEPNYDWGSDPEDAPPSMSREMGAEFKLSNLTISNPNPDPGVSTEVSVDVKNVGDAEGTYEVELSVDGEIKTKEVTLSPGEGATVTFTLSMEEPGSYFFEINGLTGSFTVGGAVAEFVVENLVSPENAYLGEPITISVDVANAGETAGTCMIELSINGEVVDSQILTLTPGESDTVTFTVTRDEEGTYEVEVDGLTGSFEVVSAPAKFVVENLSIIPEEIVLGENVVISVDVANIGGSEGTHTVELFINDEAVDNQTVTLAPAGSESVSFTVVETEVGSYSVRVENLTGSFEIVPLLGAEFVVENLGVSPENVAPGEEVTISVDVANIGEVADSTLVELEIDEEVVDNQVVLLIMGESKTISFTLVREEPGSYAVSVEGLTGSFEVVTIPSGEGVPVWSIAAVIIVILAIAGGIVYRRRK